MNEMEAAWSLIGKIGAVVAVVVSLISGIKYLYGIFPTAKLEKRVAVIEDHQKKDFEHFREIDAKLESLAQKVQGTDAELKIMNEGINRIGKSQILLLRHFVTGNGQEQMMQEADDLTSFFVER